MVLRSGKMRRVLTAEKNNTSNRLDSSRNNILVVSFFAEESNFGRSSIQNLLIS
jgi:hypothetical protein